jgi:hypothetical protein
VCTRSKETSLKYQGFIRAVVTQTQVEIEKARLLEIQMEQVDSPDLPLV